MTAKRKRDKPVYAFIRRGNYLVPEMDYDLRALEGVGQNERVFPELRKQRNPARLRAYWATLHDVVDATDCAASAEQLHEIIKLDLGFGDPVMLPGGRIVTLPGSVAFENMAEDEFVAFFRRAEDWLAETYGWVKERAA